MVAHAFSHHLSPDRAALYIGIDVGKLRHVAAFLPSTPQTGKRRPTLAFANDRLGIAALRKQLTAFQVEPAQCAVLLENTGHYHHALAASLSEAGFRVYVVAIRSKRLTGQSKTDRADALRLARLLHAQLEYGVVAEEASQRIRVLLPATETAQRLQGLVRRQYEIQQDLVRTKNRLTAILDQLFPEFTVVFRDPNAVFALRIRERFPTPAQIAQVTDLKKLIGWRGNGCPSDEKLQRLQEVARTSIGVTDPARIEALCFEQEQLIENFRQAEEHLQAAEKRIKQVLEKSREGQIMLSIPGCGPLISATILSCIGNIRNFPDVAALRKYAGWSTQETQTGKSLDRKNQTPTGTRLLRRTLFLAAMGAVAHGETNVWGKLYYRLLPSKCAYDAQKKDYIGKGRVLGRVAGQMCSVIYALLSREAELVERYAHKRALPAPTLYDAEIHAGTKAACPSPRPSRPRRK